MARIQVLELPSDVIGDAVQGNFAIIVDGATDEDMTRFDTMTWADLRTQMQARAVIVTGGTLDVG